MTKSSNALLGVVLASVLLGVAGCASPGVETDSESARSESAGSITFRSFDPPAEAAGLQDAVDKWNESNEVQVKFETVAIADALAQYTREVNGGAGPDVAQTAFAWVRDLATNDLVENLDDFLAKDAPGAGIDDFLALDLNQINGSTFGVPWTVDTFALGYDPSVLEEAGVSSIPTDWNGFAQVANRLTTSDRAGFCFAASSAPTSDLWHLFNYYIWSQGSSLVKSSGGSSTVGVNETEVASAFEYFNQFFVSGSTPATMLSVDTSGDPAIGAALANGKCAIAFVPPQSFRNALESNDKLLTAPVPVGKDGVPTTHLGGRSLTINPNSANKDAAWKFIKYLTTQGVFENNYAIQFPAQKSVVRNIDFGLSLTGYQDELPTARTYAMYVDAPSPVSEYWNMTTQTLGAVFSGQLSPEAAAPAYIASLTELVSK